MTKEQLDLAISIRLALNTLLYVAFTASIGKRINDLNKRMDDLRSHLDKRIDDLKDTFRIEMKADNSWQVRVRNVCTKIKKRPTQGALTMILRVGA